MTSHPKTYQVRRSISLPTDVDERLTALAAEHEGNRSAAVAELIERAHKRLSQSQKERRP